MVKKILINIPIMAAIDPTAKKRPEFTPPSPTVFALERPRTVELEVRNVGYHETDEPHQASEAEIPPVPARLNKMSWACSVPPFALFMMMATMMLTRNPDPPTTPNLMNSIK